MVACICIASPVLADPDPPPHPVDPLPPSGSDAPSPPPPDADTPPQQQPDATPPPAPSKYVPPAANSALPVVTVSTMPTTSTVAGEPDHDPRTAAWISTGVTVALATSVLAWWALRDHYVFGLKGNNPDCVPNLGSMGVDSNNCNAIKEGENDVALHREHVWNDTEFALGAVTAASGFITAWLWSRHVHSSHQVLVSPTSGGGSVSIGGDF